MTNSQKNAVPTTLKWGCTTFNYFVDIQAGEKLNCDAKNKMTFGMEIDNCTTSSSPTKIHKNLHVL